MITINGEYTEGIVYTDYIDECTRKQLRQICDHFALRDSIVRVMPDCHAGNGYIIMITINILSQW